jgi:hypothetical protein
MKKIRYGLIMLWMVLCSVTCAEAQVSIGIGFPNVSIGINLPLYPELVRVPGYPVYYAPHLNANYFFYDGLYWVYHNDNWYASSWYNGPWGFVAPEVVPAFILRVPVRYYRQPPVYFHGWKSNAPPRWGHHWGPQWEKRRSGWNRWNRRYAPAPAPLPVYQRQYSRDKYPTRVEQQQTLHSKHYRYQPRDTVVRQHFQRQGVKRTPVPAQRGRQAEPRKISPKQQDMQRSTPHRQDAPVIRDQRQRPGAVQREQQTPRVQGQEQRSRDKGQTQEQNRGRGQDNNRR